MRLWAVVADASTSDAEERVRLASVLEELSSDSVVTLVTCHRVEAYSLEELSVSGMEQLHGIDAVRRLMRVAAGLESAVIGENEVLHQVRVALRDARSHRRVDGRLVRLFESATSAGRAARARRTEVGAGLAARAVEWLASRASIADGTVLVAGAGRMGAELGRQARAAGAEVTVASRDRDRATRLAQVLGGHGVTLHEAAELAPHAVGVAVALAGPWVELRGPLPPVADISAPSALPERVRVEMNGAVLTIDDLFKPDTAPPVGYVQAADAIVQARTLEYRDWLESHEWS